MKLPAEPSPESIVAVIDMREQTPLDLSPLSTVRGTLTKGDYSVNGVLEETAIVAEV